VDFPNLALVGLQMAEVGFGATGAQRALGWTFRRSSASRMKFQIISASEINKLNS
jgi:hypothetical protein